MVKANLFQHYLFVKHKTVDRAHRRRKKQLFLIQYPHSSNEKED